MATKQEIFNTIDEVTALLSKSASALETFARSMRNFSLLTGKLQDEIEELLNSWNCNEDA